MRPVRVLLFGALLLLAFAWGFATDRYKVFPMPLVRALARRGGFGGWNKPDELHSRSPAGAALASIPYLTGRFDPKASSTGVTLSKSGSVGPGLSF